MLVSSKTGGATPLVIAARNGQYDIVYYMLNKTHVDCEQSGSGNAWTFFKYSFSYEQLLTSKEYFV